MRKARTFLPVGTAGLSLILTGCTGGGIGTGPRTISEANATTATMATIMAGYNTATSYHLQSLAADFNLNLPSGIPSIVYLDYDKIATWFGTQEGPPTVEKAIGDYLMAKTGRSYDAPALSLLAQAMNSLDAEGIVIQKDSGGNCLAVPEYPGISFHSAYAASFRVGQTDVLAGKTVVIDMPTEQFADFVDAHESWHCMDIRYIRDTGDGLAGAVKQNRAEMFADIGGVAEGIRNGADLTLIDKAAALHATWAFLTGPAHAKTDAGSDKHFDSVVYATQDGLYALKTLIEKMGIDNFRKLDREHLRMIDYAITDANCLTYAQAQALQMYYATGQATPAAMPLIARLRIIAAVSVRDTPPAELAERDRSAQEASNIGGLTEQAVLETLKVRVNKLGGATFANQLRARQEMTDSLRDKLVRESDPSSERITEAQLKLLFYTDPHLVPRKNETKSAMLGGSASE